MLVSAPFTRALPATQYIAETARRAVQPVARLIPPPTFPILDDMTLPDNYLDPLRLGLQTLKYSITNSHLEDLLHQMKYHFTLVSNELISRFLLRIEDAILTDPSRDNMKAVEEIKDLFLMVIGKGITLYVFHDRPPHGTYKYLMQRVWPKRIEINSKFISLSEILDLYDIEPRLHGDYLKGLLDLDVAPPTLLPAKRAIAEMPYTGIQKIADIIAETSEFRDGDAGNRRTFIEAVRLGHLFRDFDFNGAPFPVAQGVVICLIKAEMLGPLLKTIHERSELPPENKEFLATIFERYALGEE